MFSRPERFGIYYRQAAQTTSFAKRQNNVSGVFLYSDYAFYIMLDGVEDKTMLEYAKYPLSLSWRNTTRKRTPSSTRPL